MSEYMVVMRYSLHFVNGLPALLFVQKIRVKKDLIEYYRKKGLTDKEIAEILFGKLENCLKTHRSIEKCEKILGIKVI